ncbi:MAG: RidA family protein [Litorivicinaceae bacterium]|jgi:2-iminobutanoate/2-iminopropanoate deaminase|tara:strand:+ start:760 stop:1161 length:402 start_codon:yes stop_codon:yes gene_type:complete
MRDDIAVAHIKPEIEKAIGFSQCVKAGDFVFISGTVSSNDELEPLESDSIEGQYRVIYDKLRRSLDLFGLGLDSVVKESIYTEDLQGFFDVGNAVRIAAYADLDYFPSATAVEVSRTAFEGNIVEIDVVAYCG